MPNVDAWVFANANAVAITGNLNHAADVLVLVWTFTNFSGTTPTAVTVGGIAATLVANINSIHLYAVYRSPAVNEQVAVTRALAEPQSFTAVSLTNTLDVGFFDATGTGTWPPLRFVSCNIALGTANRMIIQGIGSTGLVAVVQNPPQIEIQENNPGVNIETNYLNTEVAYNMQADLSAFAAWNTISVGVIDISQDLLWKRKRDEWPW